MGRTTASAFSGRGLGTNAAASCPRAHGGPVSDKIVSRAARMPRGPCIIGRGVLRSTK